MLPVSMDHVNSVMIWLQIVVHLLSFSLCLCLCSDPKGNSVTWWILYQQKTTPFTHFYVDSVKTVSRSNKHKRPLVEGGDPFFFLSIITLIRNCKFQQ
jgi:hypothetical protein